MAKKTNQVETKKTQLARAQEQLKKARARRADVFARKASAEERVKMPKITATFAQREAARRALVKAEEALDRADKRVGDVQERIAILEREIQHRHEPPLCVADACPPEELERRRRAREAEERARQERKAKPAKPAKPAKAAKPVKAKPEPKTVELKAKEREALALLATWGGTAIGWGAGWWAPGPLIAPQLSAKRNRFQRGLEPAIGETDLAPLLRHGFVERQGNTIRMTPLGQQASGARMDRPVTVSTEPQPATPDEPYAITRARYSKGKMAVQTPSTTGMKTRAARLAGAKGMGSRYSNREHAYIMSEAAAQRFEKLYREGWDASSYSGELIAPDSQAKPASGATVPGIPAEGYGDEQTIPSLSKHQAEALALAVSHGGLVSWTGGYWGPGPYDEGARYAAFERFRRGEPSALTATIQALEKRGLVASSEPRSPWASDLGGRKIVVTPRGLRAHRASGVTVPGIPAEGYGDEQTIGEQQTGLDAAILRLVRAQREPLFLDQLLKNDLPLRGLGANRRASIRGSLARLAKAGKIELRPEAGSLAAHELSMPGPKGSILSYARAIGAESRPAKGTLLPPSALAGRLEKAGSIDLSSAPADTYFVMVGERNKRSGSQTIETQAFYAFGPRGISARHVEYSPSGATWSVDLSTGQVLPWSPPRPYDEGETPESAREWHAREHNWRLVKRLRGMPKEAPKMAAKTAPALAQPQSPLDQIRDLARAAEFTESDASRRAGIAKIHEIMVSHPEIGDEATRLLPFAWRPAKAASAPSVAPKPKMAAPPVDRLGRIIPERISIGDHWEIVLPTRQEQGVYSILKDGATVIDLLRHGDRWQATRMRELVPQRVLDRLADLDKSAAQAAARARAEAAKKTTIAPGTYVWNYGSADPEVIKILKIDREDPGTGTFAAVYETTAGERKHFPAFDLSDLKPISVTQVGRADSAEPSRASARLEDLQRQGLGPKAMSNKPNRFLEEDDRQAILRAYRKHFSPGQQASVAQIRAAAGLGERFDPALRTLFSAGSVVLYPEDDPQSLTPEMVRGAFTLNDRVFHRIKIPSVGRTDYEERRETRIERLEKRAEKARAEAAAQYKKSGEVVDRIPMGQPILVGHHSEKRHRRDIEKSHAAMGRSVAATRKAEALERRAESAKDERAISSDDPQALEKLDARIAELEAEREQIKAFNRKLRSGDPETLARVMQRFRLSETEARKGVPAYALQNLGNNIRRLQKRRVELVQLAKLPATETLTVGPFTASVNVDANRVQIRGPKVEPELRKKIKSAGFKWSPREEAWQRLRSPRAWYEAERLVKLLGAADAPVAAPVAPASAGSPASPEMREVHEAPDPRPGKPKREYVVHVQNRGYVSELPGEGGKDYGTNTSMEKARYLTEHQARRAEKYYADVGAKTSVTHIPGSAKGKEERERRHAAAAPPAPQAVELDEADNASLISIARQGLLAKQSPAGIDKRLIQQLQGTTLEREAKARQIREAAQARLDQSDWSAMSPMFRARLQRDIESMLFGPYRDKYVGDEQRLMRGVRSMPEFRDVSDATIREGVAVAKREHAEKVAKQNREAAQAQAEKAARMASLSVDTARAEPSRSSQGLPPARTQWEAGPYSDPSAAHEKAMLLKQRGALGVEIYTPPDGKPVVRYLAHQQIDTSSLPAEKAEPEPALPLRRKEILSQRGAELKRRLPAWRGLSVRRSGARELLVTKEGGLSALQVGQVLDAAKAAGLVPTADFPIEDRDHALSFKLPPQKRAASKAQAGKPIKGREQLIAALFAPGPDGATLASLLEGFRITEWSPTSITMKATVAHENPVSPSDNVGLAKVWQDGLGKRIARQFEDALLAPLRIQSVRVHVGGGFVGKRGSYAGRDLIATVQFKFPEQYDDANKLPRGLAEQAGKKYLTALADLPVKASFWTGGVVSDEFAAQLHADRQKAETRRQAIRVATTKGVEPPHGEGKIKQITVMTGSGPATVKGTIHGPVAVHKAHRAEGFGVSDLGSGMSVSTYPRQMQAKALASWIAENPEVYAQAVAFTRGKGGSSSALDQVKKAIHSARTAKS